MPGLRWKAGGVFTKRLNGQTAVLHSAGARQNVSPGEPTRVIETDIGLRSQIVLEGPGGLVSRDAGYAVIDITFSIVDDFNRIHVGPGVCGRRRHRRQMFAEFNLTPGGCRGARLFLHSGLWLLVLFVAMRLLRRSGSARRAGRRRRRPVGTSGR